MTITLPVSRGFTLRPFMVIPKWAKRDSATYDSYVAHERTHYDRQRSFFGALVWVFKYFTSKNFRFNEEVKAFAKEIKVLRLYGYPAAEEHYAQVIAAEYWSAGTEADALVALTAELAAHEG